jgi:hypothetical protein
MDLKKLATAATPKKLASYVAGLREPTGSVTGLYGRINIMVIG